MRRSLLAGLVLGFCLVLGMVPAPADVGREGRTETPARLVVLVVFDQMRADYLTRWEEIFGEDGFRRLMKDGAWFQEAHYPYGSTFTAAGHASLSTGSVPAVHGIISNEWFDRGEHHNVGAVKSAKDVIGPERLLAPTVGDVLKEATGGKARVVSLSLKDRSAVLMAGRRPDHLCYWHDVTSDPDKQGTTLGTFVTSSYYAERRPWVRDFPRSVTDRWHRKEWTRLDDDLNYAFHSGPDDAPGEGIGVKGVQGRTFPHPMPDADRKAPGRDYYKALHNTPFGSELLLELARHAVHAEALGKHDVPDLLCVSFSSNDIVGHCWGPDSQEMLDVTLRADLIVRDLLHVLDDRVGKGRYLLCMTADHGVCPLPEASRARGKRAGYVSPKALLEEADRHLKASFTTKEGPSAFEAQDPERFTGWFYLSRQWLAFHGLERKQGEVLEVLTTWLKQQKGVQSAYTRADLLRADEDEDGVKERLRLSLNPERSGDVVVVPKPYYLLLDIGADYRTTHGTPYAYDTHVPLLVYGTGVQPGVRLESVSPLAAAAILAHGLGIKPPPTAEPVPAKLFHDR
jgi:hypothetical protein